MFDISLHINVFICLIEVEHPLQTSNKRTHVVLPIYFFNWCRTFIKFISLIDVEHSLKTSNKRIHVCKCSVRLTFHKGDFTLDGMYAECRGGMAFYLLLHMSKSFVYWHFPEMLIPLKRRNHFSFYAPNKCRFLFKPIIFV